MFINPIEKINSLNDLNKIANIGSIDSKTQTESTGTELPFKDIFSQALNDYKQTEQQVTEDIYALSTGESDDLHNLMINTKKAEMSLELFVQLRNKALDAYKELIGIGI